MKNLIGFIVIAISSLTSEAQVLDSEWLAKSILQIPQKPVVQNNSQAERSVAALLSDLRKGLVVRESNGWTLVSNQPQTIHSKILLLPGFLETDFIYHRMLRDPDLETKGIQLIAGVPPGFGGNHTHSGFDFSIATYAKIVSDLASEEKVDMIVGHQLTATILIEALQRESYKGRAVLINPSLEPDDEPVSLRALDLASRSSHSHEVAWVGIREFMTEFLRPYFSSSEKTTLHIASSEALKSPPQVSRKLLISYFDHLRSSPNALLHSSLMNSETIHLVTGGEGRIQLKPEHASALKKSRIHIHSFPKASHLIMLDSAKSMNSLLLKLSGAP